MARSLDVILKELNAGYQPERNIINQKLAALPGQADSEIAGLQGQQTQAFDDILAGARDRGVGFGGIPLAEQAKYTSGSFLPAVARVRQSQNDVKSSLAGALADSSKSQREKALGIREGELDRDLTRKIELERQAREDAQARRAAAAAQQSLYGSLYGTGGGPAPTQPKPSAGVKVPPGMQALFNQVFMKADGGKWSDHDLVSDYNATYKSAGYGNAADKRKLQLYHQIRPDLFGGNLPARILDNGQNLSF